MGRLFAVHFQSDQLVLHARLLLRQQGAPAGEMALVEIDQPVHAQLERRAAPVHSQGVFGIDEFGIGQQQAGLDARHFQRGVTDRADAARLTCGNQRVPQGARVFRRDPQLVAEVAGEAGARDHHFEA